MGKSTNDARTFGFSTRAIHDGYDPQDYHGALNPPVFLSSTFAFPSAEQGGQRFAGEDRGFIYHRVGNPGVDIVERRLAHLEGGEAGLLTSSGMGAITAVLWTMLGQGDEIIADKTLYGCTFSLLRHHAERFGIKARFVDMTDPAKLAEAIGPSTKIVYCETPANPNMRICDIAGLSDVCTAHGATFVVDNTYCTPYLQRPLELGADIVVHSATKYLSGHGDLLAGAVVASREIIDKVRFVGVKEMNGAVISSFDAYLLMRGMKTLSLRMDRHSQSASRLARVLAGHDTVEAVYYPGLEDFPQHDLAKRQMAAFGGMVALELKGGFESGRRFMDALKLVTTAVSLGDAETLVQHPASMTHSTYAPEERARHGFTDGLIRISVGLEDYADIEADILEALERLNRSGLSASA
ncbi:MAG: methionine gamma-lyase [Alphaproteobacteria bacterium]|nr:methionine gamma-lyase [Alphaproteobacteria bacterium]